MRVASSMQRSRVSRKGQDLTVRRIGLSSLTMPSKVVGGNTVAGSAMLECNAAPGPIKVEFNSSNPALVHAEPASLMVPVGTQSAAFNLSTSPAQACERCVDLRHSKWHSSGPRMPR